MASSTATLDADTGSDSDGRRGKEEGEVLGSWGAGESENSQFGSGMSLLKEDSTV
ncbi:hypothetical protein AJ78_00494 [Emergomyces pasteurianus Ep9510]|uniref:Uncharacterized protein n=1 Tax=Emergomyces pasteurianus Ep9510 TaxID=1447872 RepID=A0A1J9QH45_9EURO|nr:hypothetical protein AJ78_00494 [Emergomyces pasteurianus Ep9510]